MTKQSHLDETQACSLGVENRTRIESNEAHDISQDKRMDVIEKRMNNGSIDAVKYVSLILVIVGSVIGAGKWHTREIEVNRALYKTEIARVEQGQKEEIKRLDSLIQERIGAIEKVMKIEKEVSSVDKERTLSRFEKLEEWQNYITRRRAFGAYGKQETFER